MSEEISFNNVSHSYDGVGVLHQVTLKFRNNIITAIIGKSGSGKSTLGYCLNGLIPSAYKGDIEGMLTVDGVEPHSKSIFDLSSGKAFY